MRPWVPGTVRAVDGRGKPRTGAEKPTDGRGGSGYADRPPRICVSDLLFQGSRLAADIRAATLCTGSRRLGLRYLGVQPERRLMRAWQ
jgi:hypothetical protein